MATWLPNTPRYVCSSSTTMTRSCSNSWNHFVWWGSIAEWSMSGFVTTTWPALRIADRMGAGVSPSYVAEATCSPASRTRSENSATWSCPSALVGNRNSARADGSSASAWSTGTV